MRRRNSGLWQLSVLMHSKLLCNYWSAVCAAKKKKKKNSAPLVSEVHAVQTSV